MDWNIWKSKKKDVYLPTMQIEREADIAEVEKWKKEVNFGGCYTQHTPFEDPDLVPEVAALNQQLKIDKIRQYQKQFKESLNHE